MDNGDYKRRSFSSLNPMKNISQVLSRFTDPKFLTKNSLFSHLFASQPLQLSSVQPQSQFFSVFFSKQSIGAPQMFQFTYFHRRDKKIFLCQFLLNFLLNDNKNELIFMENVEKINRQEIKQFFRNFNNGQKIISQFDKRIHFQYCPNTQIYRFNIQFLPLFLKQHQFVKCLILSDVNTFQFGDKGHFEKLYRKIPKDLLTISFRKDNYEYKFIVPNNDNYNHQNHGEQQYQLNEKVLNNSHHAYIVPVEYIGLTSSTLQQSFRSVLIRKHNTINERNEKQQAIYEFIFRSYPYKLQAYRKII